MTENDEKVAEEFVSKFHYSGAYDGSCIACQMAKEAYLAGIAHERARNKANRPEEQTVDFGTFKARVEDL